MKLTKVVVLLAAAVLTACSGDGVRHTPDATSEPTDGAVDAGPPDAPLNPAMLAASPDSTDFGDVVIGQTTSKVTYTISNSGDELSGMVAVSLDPTTGGFAISANTCDHARLGKYDTCTFEVAWTPRVSGTDKATLHIAATPGGEVTPGVTGNGLQPGALDITEASHDYTKLALGATPTTHTFTVKNTGQVATGTPMPSITGTAGTYSVLSTTCNAALAASATCNVVVKFAPTTVGSKPATLVVTGTPGGSDSATLSGIGVAHVAITKSGNGTGTVLSNMTGINCGSACAADFSATPVTLTATPDTGMSFGGWTGGCTGTTPCTLDLTEGKTVVASFTKQQFTLSTSTTGNGSGTLTLNPPGGTYNYNQVVTVTATQATGSTFTGFGGDCMGNTCSVTMTANHAVSANFDKQQFTLTTSTNGTGSGTISLNPAGGTYDYNTPVTLTANAATDSDFAKWTGDCSGSSTTCTVTMTQARSVTATFNKKQFTLTTSTSGTGSGTISLNPAGGTYVYNTPVTLTANPATDSTFAGWGGDCAGVTGATCTVTMTQPRSVTATFNKKMFTLTTGTTGTGSGTITGAGTYVYGTPVTITESAATGSTFTSWGGDCSSTGPCTVTMTTNHVVTANFDANPETLTVTSTTSNGADGGKIVSSPAGISCDNATCAHDFGYGTPVTLSAVLNTGYYVAAVVGAGCSSLPCTVSMTQAQSVTVRIAPLQFKLALGITTDPTGLPANVAVSINGGTATTYTASTSLAVNYGSTVTLTAGTTSDFLFGGWTGACSSFGRTKTCTLQITGDTSTTATILEVSYRFNLTATTQTANALNFTVTYPLSVTTNTTCTSSAGGTACTTGAGYTFDQQTLTASLPVVVGAVTSWYHLPTWTGCDSVSADHLTCTYTITGSGHAITVTGDAKLGP